MKEDCNGKSVRRFDASDVEVVSSVPVYEGFFTMKKYRLKHRRFAGDWTSEFSREVFCRQDAACMLPYDPIRDEVVLLQQFRIGALGSDASPWLLEMVAGINDQNELPEEVVRREAMEEAGLQVGDCLPICSYFASPGGATERIHLFCGQVDTTTAGGIHGLPEESEDIQVYVFPRSQAYAMVISGEINNAATIMALQWLALNHAMVKARWCETENKPNRKTN